MATHKRKTPKRKTEVRKTKAEWMRIYGFTERERKIEWKRSSVKRRGRFIYMGLGPYAEDFKIMWMRSSGGTPWAVFYKTDRGVTGRGRLPPGRPGRVSGWIYLNDYRTLKEAKASQDKLVREEGRRRYLSRGGGR